ncbi:NuA4-domain-containing protein [Atractiella rhizophila]|nr:NuA4-domain-containing protein [Atractiella rhizophila]
MASPAPGAAMPNQPIDPAIMKQRLGEARTQLQSVLERKKKIERDLIEAEVSLWELETRYLEDSLHPPPQGNSSSHAFGNIVRGYEGYVKVPTTTGSHKKKAQQTKTPVEETDRLFSLSSSTYQKSIQEKRPRSVGAEEPVGDDEDWKDEEEAREEEEDQEEEYKDDRHKRKRRKKK